MPSFFCDCQGCREARGNPGLARTRSGALIVADDRHLLIDTPPDLRAQLVRERVSHIDEIFLTHWHYDHFGGLGELEYYVKLARMKPIRLHLPPSARESFARAYPELSEIFTVVPWEFHHSEPFASLTITPLPANHGIETAGFLVKSADRTLAYFPDTAGLPPDTLRVVAGSDWLICDATFHGENWFPDRHMSTAEAIELGRKARARQTVLTHLSIHYSQPVTVRELQKTVSLYPDVVLAADGMSFPLLPSEASR